jgi:hypothetical protein
LRFMRLLFGRQAEDAGVSRELDERERELAEQERRLEMLRHLRRERDLYAARKRKAAG